MTSRPGAKFASHDLSCKDISGEWRMKGITSRLRLAENALIGEHVCGPVTRERANAMKAFQCGVCLKPITKCPYTKLECTHLFHPKCIRSWLFEYNKDRCPVCRGLVSAADREAESWGDFKVDDMVQLRHDSTERPERNLWAHSWSHGTVVSLTPSNKFMRVEAYYQIKVDHGAILGYKHSDLLPYSAEEEGPDYPNHL